MTVLQRDIIIPHDPEAEVALLATLGASWRQEQTHMLLPEIEPDMFLVPQNQVIFCAIRNVIKKGIEVNLISIKSEIDRAGLLNQVGDTYELVNILQTEELSNPKTAIDRLRELRTRRNLMKIGDQLARQITTDQEDVGSIISDTRDQLTKLLSGAHADESSTAAKAIEYARSGKPFYVTGRRYCMGLTGLAEFDDKVVIPSSEPVFLCARPGCGKTALGLQTAVESVKRVQAKPLFVSIELTEPKLMARLAAYATGVSGDDWRRGQYRSHQSALLAQQEHILSEIHTIFPDQGTQWQRIESRIRRAIDKHQVDLVIIDYFGFIGRPTARGNSEAYAFAAVSEQITAFCKNTGVGVIVLHQLKSETEASKGKRPSLSDISDTDRPSRDAAAVIMLYRDNENFTWMFVPKNRDGVPNLEWRLSFDGATGTFRHAPRETSEPSRGALWQ